MAIVGHSSRPAAGAAQSIGGTAARLLREGTRGQVAAVFSTSVYLSTNYPARYLCLLSGKAPDGPLHVRVDWTAAHMTRQFQTGQSWHVANSVLHCGRVQLALQYALPWSPEPIEHLATSQYGGTALHVGWHRWRKLHQRSAALGAVVNGTGPWPAFAKQATDSLRNWLSDKAHADAAFAAVRALAGLGTGLTPAGDDLLGGLALMLRAQSSSKLAPLCDSVMPCLHRTHPISAAHLGEALHGRASAPALDALRGVLRRDDAAVEAACTQLGHTSGWDMLAGMLLAVTAGLETGR